MWSKAFSSIATLIFLVTLGIKAEQSHNVLLQEKHILDTIFNSSSYDRRVRPVENNDVLSPTEVRVNMFVRMLSKVDDIKMQYNIQLTFRQKWRDPRMKFNNMDGKLKYLNLFEEKLWTPDLFFSNEKSGYINSLMKPNAYFRIFPDGQVLYSTRLSLVLSCPMNFKYFPFDNQVCTIRMASYGYSTNDVMFEWDIGDPVQVVKSLLVPHYTLQSFTTDYCHSKTSTGTYSCLLASFTLKRDFMHYFAHVFIPSTMLVIISWLSFWLDHQIVMTRLFTALTTLLVLSYRVAEFNATLTPVSYTRSIDVWTGTCLTFIFAALIEVVAVDYRWRQQQQKRRRATGMLETTEEEMAIDMKPLVSTPGGNSTENRSHINEVGRLRSFYYRLKSTLPNGPEKLDTISRYLFPTAFAVFNIFYWLINLL